MKVTWGNWKVTEGNINVTGGNGKEKEGNIKVTGGNGNMIAGPRAMGRG